MTQKSLQLPPADVDPDESIYDPNHTASGRAYKQRRWTLGDSGALVEGAPQESPFVAAAWIVIPLLLGCGVLFVLSTLH